MAGDNIKQVNDGVRFFKEDVLSDELARKRVDLAVISFGEDVKTVTGFSSVETLPDIVLDANGSTPMGDALLLAMDMVEQRKKDYKNTGIDHYRPWIFMITDGEPTDMNYGDPKWNNVVQRVHDGEKNKKFMFFAIGVDNANMKTLQAIASPERPPLKLQQGKFKELFAWLSRSLQKTSCSKIGDMVALDDPTGPKGWGSVPTN
ncbi:von Willebrand factor type A domain-containing protein [Candidatus Magnetobacterium bavaricum]|uniref:von Willebrand factor type A domain-containing protein n=1 Tax=Candidatus Magnetobacterium bavaricum TaxID=29290 RepID=A0A0F3GPA3_9BACT|nr:von Willebrand factor type A domain-containing protein [Candidatus Magnetobacterium bavaricum]